MRKLLTVLLIGLAAAAISAAIGLIPFFRTVELKTYDLRVRWTADPAHARSDIVVVEINEDSLRKLEPLVGRWPWPRLVHGMLLDYLARAPVKVVGYDVLFTDNDRRRGFDVGEQTIAGAESDQMLADATREAGTVVHLADVSFEGFVNEDGAADSAGVPSAGQSTPAPSAGLESGPALRTDGVTGAIHLTPPLEERRDLRLPFAALAAASRAVGHNFLVLDADGPVRRTAPIIRVGDRDIASLAWTVAMIAAGISQGEITRDADALIVRGRRVSVVRDPNPDPLARDARPVERVLIDYQGPPLTADGRSGTYRAYSFYDLFYSEEQLRAGQAPNVDPSVFKDKIVFVGTTASGLHDVFETPFGSGKIAGPHLNAHIADNVLSGSFLGRAPGWVQAVTLVLCALTAAALGAYLSPWPSSAAALAAAGALVFVSVQAFRAGVWLPVTPPILAMAIAMFSGVAYQYFIEGSEKRRVKKLFSRFVSPDVYDEILANPALASLGGRRREMTVLFSDIRGFTAASEAGTPEDIVAQLNDYFTRMVAVVFQHRGTVDKFVGDMVMALFGAPLDDEGHAGHAVAAALAMVEELKRLNVEWAAQGKHPLDIGIGINSGTMIAGNIGSDRIMSYTVIGDAVNLASRLESLNKEYATRIIISEATRKLLSQPPPVRALGDVVVKGKTQPVAIYEVLPPA